MTASLYSNLVDDIGSWIKANGSILGPVSVFAGLLLCIAHLVLSTRNSSSRLPSPGNRLPYFGHLFAMGADAAQALTRWHNDLGPIILVQLGVQPLVSIADPLIAHEILGSKGSVASDRPYNKFMSKIHSHNGRGVIFSQSNTKAWRKTRAITTSVLGPKSIDKKLSDMCQEADQLLGILATGDNIDPVPHLLLQSANFMLLICFGKRADSTEDILFKRMLYLIKVALQYSDFKYSISAYLPIVSFIDQFIGAEKEYQDHVTNERDPWIRDWIQEAHENGNDCVATALVESVNVGDIDMEAAIVMLVDIVGAGTDTTAMAIAWALGILSTKPGVQQKIRQEIDAFVQMHKRLPMFTDRDHFPYMIAVQKECMRFRPTTLLGLPHSASEDIVWRNKIIPKGATIMSHMGVMHMDPQIYPEPHIFRPERFLNKTETFTASARANIGDRDQYNFGWGRRLCPGSYLAEVHLFNVFVRVFGKCTVLPSVDTDGKETPLDLDKFQPTKNIIVAEPPRYEVRFVPRNDGPNM